MGETRPGSSKVAMVWESSCMDDAEQRWYFCLRHKTVEHGPGCPGRERLGPYNTKEEAEHALETAKRRTEEWDAQDDY
jgi:hypothetical protein